jgi:riboflavin kinase/FMN adenylyltransferase
VVHGKQMGRTIGIPTANLLIPDGVVVPAFGVYASRVVTADGNRYLAVTNVGVRPTVDDGDRVTVEPWILDFHGDLYGQPLRLEFYRHLRGERKFDGLEALKAEIHRNAQQTRDYFAQRKDV